MSCIAAALLTLAAPTFAQERAVDEGASLEGWRAVAADGVALDLSLDEGLDGHALRMDFDFQRGGGYAIARKAVGLALPANYRFHYSIRAEAHGGGPAPINDLEFKLIDPTDDNVWWHNRRRFQYPMAWTRLTSRKRQIEFAWGPSGGGDIKDAAYIEFVVTAVEGGRGTIWIDDVVFEALPPDTEYSGMPTASATVNGAWAARVLDGDQETSWTAPDGPQSITIDFNQEREFGGLILSWGEGSAAADYDVETSTDGVRWGAVYHFRGGRGGRDYVPTPEAEARYLRLSLHRSAGEGYVLQELEIQPIEFGDTPNTLFEAVASREPAGRFPRMFLNQQTYWTIVGVDGGMLEGLVGEHGDVEIATGRFSVEPFLYINGRLVGWQEADSTTHALADGYLPIPSVIRHHGPLRLRVTAFAEGVPDDTRLVLRYRVENAGEGDDAQTGWAADSLRLFLAVRPFQVNPPSQWLNTPGGTGRIERLAFVNGSVSADGWALHPTTGPDATGATSFAAGDVTEWLAQGAVPEQAWVEDPSGYGSGAFAFDLVVPPGGSEEIVLIAPLGDQEMDAPSPRAEGRHQSSLDADERQASVADEWRRKLDRVAFILPPEAEALGKALRSQLAYVLINRDGAAIQPGSRSYERSWIRDGSLTSSALLRMGYPEAAEEFARWYAPYQYDSGKVPCCVDRRGPDPTPEHDSHGQLPFLIAEIHRFTGDDAFLRSMWPHVEGAASYIDTLRQQRMGPAYTASDSARAYYGILPESISHEGYSAKPMHSYWDQLFALRGLKDTVYIAEVLNETAAVTRFTTLLDSFATDLAASYRRAMAMHGIEYLPGAVELGDFDPTSVTIAMDPVDAGTVLPNGALEATFERFWSFFEERRDSGEDWGAYTPYEWRNVGALVRLGWKTRAFEALEWYFSHRRPAAWNAFAEVVDVLPRRPRFVGDIPHTWVGSDFIRAVTDLFVFEQGDRLVLAAGVPESWVHSPTGAGVRALPTHYGPLTYLLTARGTEIQADIEGGVDVPPGGLILHAPFDRQPREALLNGHAAERDEGGQVVVRAVPARVTFRY